MKTNIKTIANAIIIIALFCASFSGFSKSLDPKTFKSGLSFEVKKSEKDLMLKLNLDQPSNKLAIVSLSSEDGEILYKFFTSNKKHHQQIDLSLFGYGEYSISVTSEGETITDKIKYEFPEVLKPRILVKHNPETNLVVIYGRNLSEDTYISISDSKGKVYYKNKINEKDFNEKLNIKNLRWGDYIISTTNKDLSHKTTVSKK
ncbi:hypothetical protein OO013_07125 [Mangrovivirga sp. M17]|uniref:Secretion system C-terminal sorting domain-containing protein n=1 Tax=Mangrovivirga halotolerans TaxID=2993936 RepID=A0ABT3RPB8_9BACT|nr:hypothetical protein [Mangrovivirga halotolerans]MCX2743629.1 hypothetical protein [Mangrovivirga halotolerans]